MLESSPAHPNRIFPWLVEIYAREQPGDQVPGESFNSQYKLKCPGTLISLRAVLTTSSCLALPMTNYERRVGDIKVVRGRFLQSSELDSTTFLEVEKIILHKDYNYDNFYKNFAIVWLKRPLTLSNQFRPVCLFDVRENTNAIVQVITGGGQNNVHMFDATLIPDCLDVPISDTDSFPRICANALSDVQRISRQNLSCNTNGAGLFTLEQEIGILSPFWTLRGFHATRKIIAGQEPPKCTSPFVFDDLTEANLQWINDELKREPPIFDATELGSKKCLPLPNPQSGMMQSCKHHDRLKVDDCSNGGDVGTVATFTCKAHYVSGYGPSTAKRECLSTGQWSDTRPLTCHIACGVSSRPKKRLIVNGVLSDRVSWPWHAAIFKKVDLDTRYICGGTLISKSLVLTAAHCVTLKYTNKTVEKESLQIVFASVSSNYAKNLKDPISKSNLLQVKSILIPDSLNTATLDSDIALVQLQREVELSEYVKPVCFPFLSTANEGIARLQLSPGSQGQTVGLGIDESGELSLDLREATLPIVSYRVCADALGKIPTDSQFCAGYTNGTSVCNGDSGSGLFFLDKTGNNYRYIIQGLVSFGDDSSVRGRCNHETYAVFTKVISFASWVQSIMEKLKPLYSR